MKKSFKKVAVLFSLVLTLVLAASVTTVTDTTEDTNSEISTYSDMWINGGLEY